MSELSTDALHMTSPLRVGRRVGRTIYAQLGPEPSDVDPLVATADSPVLAERIVRAVNSAAFVAREDTASPDEDERTAPCPDCGADVEVLDSIPSLAPVIDDHRWLGVLCSGSGTTLDRPVPAQPTEAPDAQRAAPTRDVYVRLVDSGVDSTTEPADNVRIDWACNPTGGWVPVGVEVLGADGVEIDGEPVLRGGGADGGGEDEGCCKGCVLCAAYGHLRCWLHDENGGDAETRALLIGVPTSAKFDTARRGGERFRHLHWGTVRVHAHRDWPIELDVYDANAIELNDETARELIATLLGALDLPAPAPAPAPLTVRDEVTGDRAVSAPLGTKLGAKSAAVAAVHTTGGWSVTGMSHEQDHEAHVRVNEWVVLALPDGNAS